MDDHYAKFLRIYHHIRKTTTLSIAVIPFISLLIILTIIKYIHNQIYVYRLFQTQLDSLYSTHNIILFNILLLLVLSACSRCLCECVWYSTDRPVNDNSCVFVWWPVCEYVIFSWMCLVGPLFVSRSAAAVPPHYKRGYRDG